MSASEAVEEYEIGSSDPSRGKARRMMKAEFQKREHPVDKATVDDACALRKRILSISLFPNLYNSEMIHKESGSE